MRSTTDWSIRKDAGSGSQTIWESEACARGMKRFRGVRRSKLACEELCSPHRVQAQAQPSRPSPPCAPKARTRSHMPNAKHTARPPDATDALARTRLCHGNRVHPHTPARGKSHSPANRAFLGSSTSPSSTFILEDPSGGREKVKMEMSGHDDTITRVTPGAHLGFPSVRLGSADVDVEYASPFAPLGVDSCGLKTLSRARRGGKKRHHHHRSIDRLSNTI
ncbi:hypothetical protein EW146_g5333 [Bondarzewia mesenterica]|uniref:Uncharacterized protein n=1 Tax=Bondarzewia mesenterica TaxID=1095465 RepID=A0A4S4LXM8_9AGAM|nr:hypothetical protein EW146_g5333 [Bondarzewia mesenterica]